MGKLNQPSATACATAKEGSLSRLSCRSSKEELIHNFSAEKTIASRIPNYSSRLVTRLPGINLSKCGRKKQEEKKMSLINI